MNIGYITTDPKFKLEQVSPINAFELTNYAETTGFTVGANVGVDKNGPSAGLDVSYSSSNTKSHYSSTFPMTSSKTNKSANFAVKLSKDIDLFKDYFYWEWDWGYFTTLLKVKDLPGSTDNEITPVWDVVFSAPGDYNGFQKLSFDVAHSVIALYSGKKAGELEWTKNQLPITHSTNKQLTVDFSKVVYPHLALDGVTRISQPYAGQTGDKSRAVDGEPRGEAYCAITAWGNNPYIDIELDAATYIFDIDVWDSDVYRGYLSDFYVFVSDEPFTSDNPEITKNQNGVLYRYQSGQPTELLTKFATNRQAKYIRVQRATPGFLIVGEIAVNPRRRGQ